LLYRTRWTPGASIGITVAGGNGRGSAANQLNSPMHVIYMPSTGNLIITDSGNARIQVWTPNGTCGITVISSQFTYPIYSAFDSNNQYLYVLDQVACLAKRFTLVSNTNLCSQYFIKNNYSLHFISQCLVPSSCTMITPTTAATNPSSTSISQNLTTPTTTPSSWIIVLSVIGTVTVVIVALSIYTLKRMIKLK